MTEQSIPSVPAQPSLLSHQTHRFATTIRTALIWDSLLLRSGLQYILQDTRFSITEAASVTGLRRLHYCAFNRDLVLIEANQNNRRVLKVVREVRDRSPETRIVTLADQFDSGFLRAAYEAGVSGFCLTASSPEVLIKSLELVILGETVLPSAVFRSFMASAVSGQDQPLQDNSVAEAEPPVPRACKLSTREREILGFLTKGQSNKVIARKLEITEATIKAHVRAILRKIGATNRTQAAMWASQRLLRGEACRSMSETRTMR